MSASNERGLHKFLSANAESAYLVDPSFLWPCVCNSTASVLRFRWLAPLGRAAGQCRSADAWAPLGAPYRSSLRP